MQHRQKNHTTMVLRTLLKPIGLVLIIAVGLILFADRFLHNALNTTILNDARSNAETWTQKASLRYPELAQVGRGQSLPEDVVSDMIQSASLNNVFRFKLFDPTGRLVFVSDEPVFSSESSESGVVERVADVYRTGETDTSLHNGEDKTNRPDMYAESYVKAVMPDGTAYGVIEVYVDVSELSGAFHGVFHVISRILILGSAIAYLVPSIFFIARREKVREQSRKILHLTKVDPLTGLLNRRAFSDQINSIFAVEGAKHPGVIFIDMDFFKQINDGLGHEFGDGALKQVASILNDVKSDSDVLCRYGGDEFILVTRTNSAEALGQFAEEISEALNVQYTFKDSTITLAASIGAHLAAPGETADDAIHNADLALHHAKKNQRGTVALFSPELDQALRRRRYVEMTMQKALAGQGKFNMEFQPIFSANEDSPVGYEALMRLKDEDGNSISPAEFIPVAEECGIMRKLGTLAIQCAVSIASRWPSDRFLSVNLSASQFESGDLLEVVTSALDKSDFTPSRLHLEITESLLIESKSQVAWQLDALKELGVSISLDDFGTGYSGLGYLLEFQFDTLKIDRMFLPEIDDVSGKKRHLISTAIELGKKLEMDVIVEGIETDEQLEFLTELGCNYFQGFLLGRPVPNELILAQDREAQKAARSAQSKLGIHLAPCLPKSVRHALR